MGAPEPPRRRQAGAGPVVPVARVVVDVAALSRPFDYAIPDHLRDQVQVGTIVRVPLHGRRVRGWVVELAGQAETDRRLLPIARVTGAGPGADLIDLGRWAAWRWAGHLPRFLNTASPPHVMPALPPPPAYVARTQWPACVARTQWPACVAPARTQWPAAPARRAGGEVTVVRVPPAGDTMAWVTEAAAKGDALVLAPSYVEASLVAAQLRRAGHRVALAPRDWGLAAAGGCVVVGTRAAAWAPLPALAAVVVLDEHDEVYQEERSPTWNARDVAVERARRAGVPCLLTSPCPSLEALAMGTLLRPSRDDERGGWPVLEVVDRRAEPPGRSLYSDRLVALVRDAAPDRRVVCVLNRKGRVQLLACATCSELTRCLRCHGPMEQGENGLECRRCGAVQPPVCTSCGSSRLKALRIGVSRVRDELELLAGQPVAEITADGASPSGPPPEQAVLVGTSAVLHRLAGAAAVAFLDFDQELLAPRFRAAEQAMSLLARAARLVGGRSGSGRLVVQTRTPDHEVLDAVLHADPGRLAVVESARRAALSLPPEKALARVSGPAADEFVTSLRPLDSVELLGPGRGGWLVRAPDHRTLCDALAVVARPAGRVRIEVDPLRA